LQKGEPRPADIKWRVAETKSGSADKRGPAESKIRYAWVQMMPDELGGKAGGRMVRAIMTEADNCPTLKEDGRTITMRRRSPPSRAAFPVVMCDAEVGASSSARLDDRTLPARPVEPNDIVVIGDTGCRMVYYEQEQSCFDYEAWPFKRNILNAVKQITGQSFVLHLGDLHYREHACPDSSARCGGSPYGDNWETWDAEFFAAADPLLRAVPWIIMRGNHENCERAGAGWVFFFALHRDGKDNEACEDDLKSYKVSIGRPEGRKGRVLAVMDTSNERSQYSKTKRTKAYVEWLSFLDDNAKLPDEEKSEIWLAIHQPLWLRNMNGFQDGYKVPSLGPCEERHLREETKLPDIRKKLETNKSQRLARLVLAGDTHAFQFFKPKSATLPIQIVAGNGGTQLDELYPKAKDKSECPDKDEKDQPKIKASQIPKTDPDEAVTSFEVEGSALTFVKHGFTVLHRESSEWTATQFDSAGNKVVACRFSEAASPTAADEAGCDRMQ